MGILEQVKRRACKQRIPLTVHFDLTYRCHQRCLPCYLPESELHTPQVRSILDQQAAAGAFFLAFSGGEIFRRSNLLSILEYARGVNFSLSLMSSGTCALTEVRPDLAKSPGGKL